MSDSSSAEMPTALYLASNQDLEGETRSLGISTITFKMKSTNSNDPFILENIFHAKGGPARHLHHNQDEWFLILEGIFKFEVGSEQFLLQPGDSLLAPRRVPHVWASIGETHGRILISFFPAGKMEDFFREVTKARAMPPLNPEIWRTHGMELLGPPLPVA